MTTVALLAAGGFIRVDATDVGTLVDRGFLEYVVTQDYYRITEYGLRAYAAIKNAGEVVSQQTNP